MSQWSQVSRIALYMAKVNVTDWVSQSVTRSPIELFWTAKNEQTHNETITGPAHCLWSYIYLCFCWFDLLGPDQSRQWCIPPPRPQHNCLRWMQQSVALHWSWNLLGRCSDKTWEIYSRHWWTTRQWWKINFFKPLLCKSEKVPLFALAVCLCVGNVKFWARHHQGRTGTGLLWQCQLELSLKAT